MWAGYEEWVAKGNKATLSVPTTTERNESIRQGVYDWLNTTVQANGYDDIVSCVSYAGSKVPKHKKEGQAALDWRDAINNKLLELVASPPAGITTLAQVLALMPQPETFGWVRDAAHPGSGPKVETGGGVRA